MAKRGENIRKRKDGRWEARYEAGRREDGRIKYGYAYGKTYNEAKKKRDFAIRNATNPEPMRKGYTMEKLCEEWKEAVRNTVKETTFACYDTLIQKHIQPYFFKYQPSKITTDMISRFTRLKSDEGLSKRTVKCLLVLLQNILRYGEKQGYLSMNGLDISYPKAEGEGLHTLAEEDVQKMVDFLLEEQTYFSTGILLCIYTGIRVGELSGLKWKDFDFGKRIMSIQRTVSRVKNLAWQEGAQMQKTRIVVGTPKSVSSLRNIPIPEFLAESLQAQQTAPEDYIMTGSPMYMEPRNIQRRFQTLLKRCDIAPVNIHAIRHAFATRCTEVGFDSKTLSEILGHSSTKITMDIYVHSNMKQKRDCLDKLYY